MRTLSAELLAAQKAASGTPYTYVLVGSTDYTSRLKELSHEERPFGGVANVLLDNSDGALTDLDLTGEQVTIGYGYDYGSVEYSNAPPLWVLTQRGVSQAGAQRIQLICIDLWLKLAYNKIIAGGGYQLEGTMTGTFSAGWRVHGQTSEATATIYAVGLDYILVGNISGTFSADETVEVIGNTDITISNIVATEVGGGSSPTWDRTTTVLAIIQAICSGICDVVLDSSDGIVDVYTPYYRTEIGQDTVTVIQDNIGFTKSAILAKNDGKLHIFDVTEAPVEPDYTYDETHKCRSDLYDIKLVLPNSFIVVSIAPGTSSVVSYSGSAKDDAAIAKFMEIKEPLTFEGLESNDECDDIAEARLNRVQKEATRGEVEAQMNCGQELFDYVKVVDPRNGKTYYGWAGSIVRKFSPGVYSITLGLGQLFGAVESPTVDEFPLPNVGAPPLVPAPTYEVIPKAIQGYDSSSITFTSVDQDTVEWTSGTIKFYDGSTQAISVGSYDIPDSAQRVIYFDLADASPNVLKKTDNYLGVFSQYTGIVCVVQKGSDAAVKASILPSMGKMPLVTSDLIYLTGLLDKIPDTDNYRKAASAALSAAGLVLLAQSVQTSSYRTVTDAQKTTWTDKPDNMDEIDPGSIYGKVLLTDILAGHLKLTSNTVVDGEWYDEAGVEIDATHGINIYGTANALTTRATKTGTIQCYVGADGKIYAGGGAVVLDAAGIHRDVISITESSLLIDTNIANNSMSGGNLDLDKGCIYGISVEFSNETDSADGFVTEAFIYNSDNNVPALTMLYEGAGTPRVLFIAGYTGSLSGETTPNVYVNIINYTGATKHFHAKVYYTKML